MSRASLAPAVHLPAEFEQSGAHGRHSVSALRGIIDMLPGLVWSARVDGSVELLSRRWGDYTGKAEAELLGWAWMTTDLIHPEDQASIVKTWAALLASGKEGRMEARLRRADGTYRWFQIQVGPVLDERGDVVR